MPFGIPYKGSKSKLAEWILSYIPQDAPVVLDVFAGGCAITDALLRRSESVCVLSNDRNALPLSTYAQALSGTFCTMTPQWVSREDFYALRGTDAYTTTCFSYGSDGFAYFGNALREQVCRARWAAVVCDDWGKMQDSPELCRLAEAARPFVSSAGTLRARRLALRSAARLIGLPRVYVDLQPLEAFGRLCSLSDGSLSQRFTYTVQDYRSLSIPSDAFVYCDPPYAGTGGYACGAFDSSAFYDWAESTGRTHPVLISEYQMPADRFTVVAERQHTCNFNVNGTPVTERLYTPSGGVYARQYM